MLTLDATLRYAENTSTLQLVDNQTAAVLKEDTLDQASEFLVQGTTDDDILIVDFSVAFAHDIGVHFEGLAGLDVLQFEGGAVEAFSIRPDRTSARRITDLDGSLFTHAGVESVISTMDVNDASVTLEDGDDASVQNTTSSQVKVTVNSDGQPTDYVFDTPLVSLSIASSDNSITTSVEVGDMNLGGGDFFAKASTITVNDSAMITDVGDFNRDARHIRSTNQFVVDVDVDATFVDATVSIGSKASIDAASFTATAYTEDTQLLAGATQNLSEIPQEILNGLVLNDITELTDLLELPISILLKNANSQVVVNDGVTIMSSGDLNLGSQAVTNGDAEGIMWIPTTGGLAFTYVQAESIADVTVSTGAMLTAGGNVSITTSADTTTRARSRVFQNLGFTNAPNSPNAFAFSVAIGASTISSHADVQAGSVIEAGGNVVVSASGADDNSKKIQAKTLTYRDGKVGMTFTYYHGFSDVSAKVDGSITAGGAAVAADQSFNPFLAVDADANTISLPGHTFTTGDRVLYSSDLQGPIGGLTTDTYYNVIVVDESTIQLADSRVNAVEGVAIDFAALPQVTNTSTRGDVEFRQPMAFSRVDSFGDAILFDFDPGIESGDTLVYKAAEGRRVGGLAGRSHLLCDCRSGQPAVRQAGGISGRRIVRYGNQSRCSSDLRVFRWDRATDCGNR